MLSKSAARAFFLLGTIDFAAVFLLLTWYTAPAMIMRYMSQRESLCGPQDRPSDCLSDHGTGWLLWVSWGMESAAEVERVCPWARTVPF